jgi:anti-sigma B factor antagonist
MEIVTKGESGAQVVTLRGDLTAGGPEAELLETVSGLLRDGCRRVVVDLSSVVYVDSAGIGSLVRCLKRCGEVDGDLRLAGVSSRLKTLLDLARLIELFQVFDDVEAALDPGDA